MLKKLKPLQMLTSSVKPNRLKTIETSLKKQRKGQKKRLKMVTFRHHSLKNISTSRSHSLNALHEQKKLISVHKDLHGHFRFQVKKPFEQTVILEKESEMQRNWIRNRYLLSRQTFILYLARFD